MPSLLDDPYGDPGQSGRSLLGLDMPQIRQPDPDQPDQGAALGQTYQMVMDEMRRQQQISADRGLWSGGSVFEGGRPTGTGLLDAGQQYAQGLLAGTTAPEFRATPGLLAVPDRAPGEDLRVPTRVPTAKPKAGDEGLPDPHTNIDLKIGIDAARQSTDAYANNAAEMRDYYPDLPLKGLRNPDKITDAAIAHMKDNLVWLHDEYRNKFGQDTVDRAGHWYDGANRIASEQADQNGYQLQQVGGVLANLSPQKDWFQNAELGKRTIDIVRNKQDLQFTPEMNNWATDYLAQQRANADTPTKQAAIGNLEMSLGSLQRGQTLRDINDPDTRALFVRAYDEAHNDRSYPTLTPEGDVGDLALNSDGSQRKIAWGSFGEIKKALAALDSPDMGLISAGLGGNHKVRSFHNNIVSPNAAQDDITIDTHAIAAAHGRPLGSSDQVVANGLGLGGSSDAATGSKGMYGIYHEAYRQAAEQLKLLPRQMQSIAWEAVRGLFSPEQKRDNQFYNDNYDIWSGFRNGKYSADEARAMVLNHAGGIKPPSWWTPPPGAQVQ